MVMRRLRTFALAAVLFLLTATVCFAAIPDMKGSWEEKTRGPVLFMKEGFVEKPTDVRIVITEQKGNLFRGYKEYIHAVKKERMSEKFIGTVDSHAVGGRYPVSIVEEIDGTMSGYIGGDEMSLHYVESGKDIVVVYFDLHRVKK